MAGIVTGSNILTGRYPYDSSDKQWPVVDTDLKEHIVATGSYDDDLLLGIHGLLASATEEAESRGQVALIEQTRIQYISEDDLADLEGTTVELTVRPVISVTAIKYLDSNDDEQTLSTSLYRVVENTQSVYFKTGLPTLAVGPSTLWIEYKAGYGQATTDVPPAWAHIVKLIAARRYDYRSGDGTNQADAWERMMRGLVRLAGDSSHRG